MENRIKRFLLNPAARCCLGLMGLLALSTTVHAETRPLIEPDVRPQKVDEALIDTENFELGAFAGFLNIEDFETSSLWGLRLAYHLNERFFLEANLGFAEAGETSFERFSGGVQVLSDDERDYRYYNVNFGFNLFPGEAFYKGLFSDQTYALNTNFYVIAGAGATDFAGDNRFTANVGVGYQVLMNDWLAWHVSFREHMYDIDVLGESKTSFNSEFSSGLSVFF